MKHNIDIANAVIAIGSFLESNEHIQEFCQDNFGKKCTVIGGETLRRQIPGTNETPFIVVNDFDKREGLDIEFCRYRCTLCVGVSGESNDEFFLAEGVNMLDAYDVTAKFINLIIDELGTYRNGDRPLSIVETQGPAPIEADGSLWMGFIDCTWRLYQTMGSSINTDF